MTTDQPDPKPKKNIGLNSKFAKKEVLSNSMPSKSEAAAKFNNAVDGELSKMEVYKSSMWDLAVKFKNMIESRVLKDNRGPIAESLEKEVIDKLIKLASELDADENQAECAGTNALCILMMKCMLIQRDTINKLSYDLEKIKEEVATSK